jgi:hypothetical protein
MTLSDLYELYKAWQQAKGAIDKVKGSTAAKILELSGRVDQLIRDYSEWKDRHDDKLLANIRLRLQTVKKELSAMATKRPEEIPLASKPQEAVDYAWKLLDNTMGAYTAQQELLRIAYNQVQEDLPQDNDMIHWPASRARLIQAQDQFQLSARQFRVRARKLDREVADAQTREQENRSIRQDPSVSPDQYDDIDRQYKEWYGIEMEARDAQKRFLAMAEVLERSAANLTQTIEATDLVYKKLHEND